MLRRHAFGFRTLLMLVDAGLAVALLVVLSFLRFGDQWPEIWRPVLDQPVMFAVGYGLAWVAVLWFHGLYRPRARWSIRSGNVERRFVHDRHNRAGGLRPFGFRHYGPPLEPDRLYG